jgi:polar amino acid transport system permease protein
MGEFFRNFIEWWPVLRAGLRLTLTVSAIAMPAAMVLGLAIALVRLGHSPLSRVLKPFVILYVEIMRGLPLILILFILYFALPAFGFRISTSAVVVGTIGLSMNLSAYLSEVFRAAIQAVDPGQQEAALSLGMTPRRTYRKIVLPQAMRVAVPTLGGYFIALLKDSSLLGFISVEELLRSGVDLVSVTFRAGEVYVMVGLIYLTLSVGLSFLIRRLERRLTPTTRARPRPGLRPSEVGIPLPGGER